MGTAYRTYLSWEMPEQCGYCGSCQRERGSPGKEFGEQGFFPWVTG